MLDDSIDPASLDGDALTQWYLRSPADVERQRQAVADQRYQDFFHGDAGADPDPGFDRDAPAESQGIDPGFAIPPPASSEGIDPGFTWIQVGPNRLRSAKIGTDDQLDAQGLFGVASDGDASPADAGLRADVSYRPHPTLPSSYGGFQPSTGSQPSSAVRPPPIDPSKTPVFQTGPDGKLHPIPGWHTTGPFDFGAWSHNIDWGGVAKDLGNIAMGAATFLRGAGLGRDLLSALGPEAETAVSDGIAEAPAVKAAKTFHSHHPHPKYMGGADDQERVLVEERLHHEFHSALGKAHREAGFPPVGGRTGSQVKWDEHFELHPGSYDEAMEILRRVSREFDKAHGTDISSKLGPAPGSPPAGAPPPD